MSEVLVRGRGLSKTYPVGAEAIVALKNATFEVNEGERIALWGPSGSGKTTLLHLMAGLEAPSEGAIEWPGLGPKNGLLPKKVAVAFQGPSLIPALSVAENVALPLLLCGATEQQAGAAAKDLLERLDLGELVEKLPEELSGGQVQRAGVARALIASPRLVLADEPTGQQDHATGARLMTFLLETVARVGAALVVATHDPLVADLLDVRWTFEDGSIAAGESVRSG
jgi:ABC-type lipoprotein export system ATPase subunit